MYIFNPHKQFRIDDHVEAPSEDFQNLPAANKKMWREQVLDYFASALFEQLNANERERRDYEEMMKNRRDTAAAELAAQCRELSGRNINEMEGAIRFFRKIGCSINPLEPGGNPDSYADSNADNMIRHMIHKKRDRFLASFGLARHVVLSAPPETIKAMVEKHGMAETLAATLPDGRQALIYALPVRVPGVGWNNANLNIKFTLEWSPAIRWSSPVINDKTGDLPRLPEVVENYFRICHDGDGLASLILAPTP